MGFLNSVCGIEGERYSCAKAETQISISDVGVLDLVIVCTGDRDRLVVVVENKLKAKEGKKQTVRYSSPKCRKEVARRFDLERKDCDWKYVFLTLFPDEPSPDSSFATATYHDLLSELSPGVGREDPLAERLLQDWRQILAEFYDRGQIHPRDVVTEKLKDSSGLEGGYLYFQKLINSLILPEGVEIRKYDKESHPGRRYFYAKIGRPSWAPAPMQKVASGNYRINPHRNFDLHVEPRFNPLDGVLHLYLHYEISPYRPAPWVRKNTDPAEYQQYLDVRRQFAKRLKDCRVEDLRITVSDRWTNMIGKSEYDYTGRMYPDVKRQLEQFIRNVTENVDSLFAEMGLG